MAAQHYANKQCYSLLVRVKNTVESLLSSDHCNIFSTYGGLKRLSDNIQDLFQHQLQVGGGNFWPVIQQLCKASLIELNTGKAQHDKIEAQECPSRIWLEFSLSNHCLSKSIYELSLHQTELCLFYAEGAFLRSNFCREALQRCLEAVERSDPAILAEVNPAQLRKQLENVNNLSTPNLSFHSSQETFPTSSQFSLLSSSQPVQSGSLYMRRSFSYDNGHQIANSNLKRHQSQPQNSSILDETDPSLNSTTLDNSSDKGKECRQRKRSVFNRPQELSGLSSSIQQSYTIAEEENEVDVPLPDGILKTRSKSQPWNIYNLSQDTCSNNGRNRVINFHRSLTPNQADAYTPLSASVSTGLDEDSSLPGSLESQLMRLLSTKSNDEENDNNNYNQLPVNLSNYHAIDPLTSGDPLQAVQHDSTPIKVTKITTSNNQRKLHELTKVGNFTNPIHSNRTENKRKLFTSGSSSDETNLDDIFSPTFENNASDRSQFQFNVKVTSDKLLSHKDIVARSPVLQSSNIAFENTDDLTSQDKTSRELNINSEISPKQKKGKNRKISISSQQPSNPVDRELSDIVRDIAMLSDIASTEELERENAHISLAESVITHIEAIRCQKILEPLDCTFNEEVEDESSGDEVSQLGKNDSADVISNSWEDLSNVNESTVNSTIDELKVSRSNTLTRKKSYDSYSQYIQTESKESGNDTNSAEYLARSLLASVAKQYSDKPAADTNLLISDTEVPQELLPNPVLSSESATNSTLTESMEQSTPRIRGNLEWAPPRQQIIFIIHPQTKRKTVIAQANYRCAGCGMKVDKGI
ncbi:Run domain Beclin-1-interacting and cysteine-rich domain-containing protein [Trichoplax sp. H2]|nr:Run domain Beclin-1-interacting and cysteine-rich domain-containing protein [Trichoplax sp. H2]|eukprot:RDD37538.1 Run domain Beclin-1-interacting and cysteine-rich domain-containing protein [Trichoplax sp. H2]